MGGLSLGRAQSHTQTVYAGLETHVTWVVADILGVTLSTLLAYLFRFGPHWTSLPLGAPDPLSHKLVPFPFEDYLAFLLLYACLTALFCQVQGLHQDLPDRSTASESLAVFEAVALATFVLITFIYLSKHDISRLVVGFSGVLTLLSLTGWRWAWRRLAVNRIAQGRGVRNVLVIGAGRIGQEVSRYLSRNKHLGYVVRGFLDEDHLTGPHVLGKISDLHQVARAYFVDDVFVTIASERELVKTVICEARRCRVNVKVVPDLYDRQGGPPTVEYLGDLPLMVLHREPIPRLGLLAKRALDASFSAIALIALSPVFAALAIAVKLDSRQGPVLYRSIRVGKKGRRFTCYKFRTMVLNADALKDNLRHLNERQGPFFKIQNDPRLTRLGKFLRKYSLDELPQFWNVMRGDMSLVGPRPHPTDDCERYSLEELRRLDVTPGITGLWQVTSRADPSFRKNLIQDIEYIEEWSLWLDLKIIFRTFRVLLDGTGR